MWRLWIRLIGLWLAAPFIAILAVLLTIIDAVAGRVRRQP